jgi:hypothetical protein
MRSRLYTFISVSLRQTLVVVESSGCHHIIIISPHIDSLSLDKYTTFDLHYAKLIDKIKEKQTVLNSKLI